MLLIGDKAADKTQSLTWIDELDASGGVADKVYHFAAFVISITSRNAEAVIFSHNPVLLGENTITMITKLKPY